MNLLHNWRAVLRYAWSVRLMVIAAVLSGLEVALPFLDGVIDVRPGVLALASGLVTAAALIARILAQSNLPEG